MHPSDTTYGGVFYQSYPHLYHGPWNELFRYPDSSYPIEQLPSDLHAYHHYLKLLGPLHPRKKELIPLIKKAMDGEYSAISCYKQLEHLAPTQKEKKIIHEIRKDEIRHLNTFSAIYTQLTGKKYDPKISEKCPNEYKPGLDFAFCDEQNTVDHYLDISAQTDNKYIKEQFTRAASDEQNHAVWFLYFLK